MDYDYNDSSASSARNADRLNEVLSNATGQGGAITSVTSTETKVVKEADPA